MDSSAPSSSSSPSRGFSRLERKLCTWLNKHYNCRIDPTDKSTLTAALADGVVLCKLIRDVSGDRNLKFKAKKPNLFAINENIRTFSAECQKLGLKGVTTLAPSDLRDGVRAACVCACVGV